jgi:hypothetical protein
MLSNGAATHSHGWDKLSASEKAHQRAAIRGEARRRKAVARLHEREDASLDTLSIPLGLKLAKHDVDYWKSRKINFTWLEDSSTTAHGIAAGERMLAIRSALKTIRTRNPEKSFLKVGAIDCNPSRILVTCEDLDLSGSMSFHFNTPINHGAAAIAGQRVADHLPGCNCDRPCSCANDVDALLYTHSAYSLGPAGIIHAMSLNKAKIALVIIHHVEGHYSTLCHGQVKCERTPIDGNLMTCKTKGNTVAHSHPPTEWLSAGSKQVSDRWDEDDSLVWTLMDSIGDTHVYLFEIVGDHLSPQTNNALSIALDSDELKFINTLSKAAPKTKAAQADFQQVHLPAQKVVITDSDVILQTSRNETVVLIPRGLIGELMLIATVTERSPLLLNLLVARGKSKCKDLNLPPDKVATAVLYASVVAMYANLEEETAVIGSTNRMFAKLRGVHAEVLRGKGLRDMTCWERFYQSLSCIDCLPFFHLACLPRQQDHDTNQAMAWRDIVNTGYSVKMPDQITYVPEGEKLFLKPHLQPKVGLYDLAPGTSLKIGEPNAKHLRQAKSERMQLVGIGFTDVVPYNVPNSFMCVVMALNIRLLKPVEGPSDPDIWNEMRKEMSNFEDYQDPRYNFATLPEDKVFVPDMSFGPSYVDDATFLLWAKRFPANKCNLLLAARAKQFSHEADDMDRATSVETLVKIEKTGMLTSDGPTPSNPRAISSPAITGAVVTDPCMHIIGTALKELNSDFTKPLVWPAGKSAEDFGEWFDEYRIHFHAMGPLVYVLIDFSDHDARQQDAAQKFIRAVFQHNGAPRDLCRFLRQRSYPHGKAQGKPIFFKSDVAKTLSGEGKTYSGNCIMAQASMNRITGPPHNDTHASSLSGDDVLVVSHTGFILEKMELMPELCEKLGIKLKTKLVYNIFDVEFCQLLPWPTADGTVWGPKIGRSLYRLGWTTSTAPNMYGTAKSLAVSCSHIPMLSNYIDAILRLAAPTDVIVRSYSVQATERRTVHPTALAFAEARYGVSLQTIISFGEMMDKITQLPVLCNFTYLRRMCEIDGE